MNAPRIKTHTQYEHELKTAKAARDEARATLAKERAERAAERQLPPPSTAVERRAAKSAIRARSAVAMDLELEREVVRQLRAALDIDDEVMRVARARAAAFVDANISRDVTHGLVSTYAEHGCRCDLCKRAKSDENRRLQKQMRSTDIPADAHGSHSTYRNRGCRCGPCTRAASEYVARARAKKRIARL